MQLAGVLDQDDRSPVLAISALRELCDPDLSQGTEGLQTRCRREMDSNCQFRTSGGTVWPSSVALWAFLSARSCAVAPGGIEQNYEVTIKASMLDETILNW